jgi:hypothetical protein
MGTGSGLPNKGGRLESPGDSVSPLTIILFIISMRRDNTRPSGAEGEAIWLSNRAWKRPLPGSPVRIDFNGYEGSGKSMAVLLGIIVHP